MSLASKLVANLVTPETSLFRFCEGELEAIDRELARLHGRTARILIVPCSHGEEAFTMSAYFLKRSIDFQIDAFDVQPELIIEAATGRLTFGFPNEYLEEAGRVSKDVLDRIRFRVGDAFSLPLVAEERYDIVLCRNFIGYFVFEQARRLVEGLAARVRPGGTLMLDGHCLSKFAALNDVVRSFGASRFLDYPVFMFPDSVG